jgi:hypothetical protein
MQLLGDDVDGYATVLIHVGQRHQDHPLRTADAQSPRPEVAELLEVHAYRGDHPGESPDHVLILSSGSARAGEFRRIKRARSPFGISCHAPILG